MSKVIKFALIAILVFVWINASLYVFNHINAWAGIGLIVLGLIISVEKSINFLKTKTKDEENL
jgi:hypothetical protein